MKRRVLILFLAIFVLVFLPFVSASNSYISINSPQNVTYNSSYILINISSDYDYVWYTLGGVNYSYAQPIIKRFSNQESLTAYGGLLLGSPSNQTTINFTITPVAAEFISVWKTDNVGTSATNQITLPLTSTGDYNFTVDWGDGSNNTITSYSDTAKTHTYSVVGTYTITITGDIEGFSFNNGGDAKKLVDIQQWGPLKLGDDGGYFYGCADLAISATDTPLLYETTNYNNFFRDVTFSGTIDLSDWDTYEATSMAGTFNGVTFDSVAFGVTNWDVSKVENVNLMFGAAHFVNDVDFSSWDMSSVTNVAGSSYGGMFRAAVFDGVANFSNWNMSGVIDFSGTAWHSGMYHRAVFYDDVDFSNWVFGEGITRLVYKDARSGMFHTTNFQGSIYGMSDWDTSGFLSMKTMFRSCSGFTADISSWNVSGVTDMSGMFTYSGMLDDYYNSLLISWSNLPELQSGVTFTVGSSKYDEGYPADSRQKLIDDYGWIIGDGGSTGDYFMMLTIESAYTSPDSDSLLKPNMTVNFSARLVDFSEGNTTVTLFLRNLSTPEGLWLNKSMELVSGNSTEITFQTNYTFPYTTEQGYDYEWYVYAEDELYGNDQSDTQNISLYWDCDWFVETSLGPFIGFNEQKFITNYTILNVGDAEYRDEFNNSCDLDFFLQRDGILPNRFLLDGTTSSIYIPTTISVGENVSISINSTFYDSPYEEAPRLRIEEIQNLSGDNVRYSTFSLVSFAGGPYLYQEIISDSQVVYLKAGSSFQLSSYITNLLGSETYNETLTAFNVTSTWRFDSSIFSPINNSNCTFYSNISNSSELITSGNFSLVDVASISPGTKNFSLETVGYLTNDSLIMYVDNASLLNDTTSIILACYPFADEICVSACGYPSDPDCSPVIVTEEVETGGGSGGGSGGASSGGFGATSEQLDALFQTNETFIVVRGANASFPLKVENPFDYPLTNISVVLDGFMNQYLRIESPGVNQILPNKSLVYDVYLDAPDYLDESNYDLLFTITGLVDESTYSENYTITRLTYMNESRIISLFLVRITELEARSYFNSSLKILDDFLALNLSIDSYQSFVSLANASLANLEYGSFEDFYQLVKEEYSFALETLSLFDELSDKINWADYNGLKVPETRRLLSLSEAALERGDYQTAILRARDAQFNFALETVGAFNVVRFVINNWWQVLLGLGALTLLVYFVILFIRRAYYSYRIKSAIDEKQVLFGLMKQVQKECFTQGKLSMEEYTQNMVSYEERLNKVISNLIKFTNKKHNLFRFWLGTHRQLVAEKNQLLDLIKQNQKEYLRTNTLETRVYQNRMKSYSSRLGELEEKLAFVEAKKRLKKHKRSDQ